MIKRSGRGLVGPAGLLLALLCFGLPFLTVSCESPVMTVTADYSGWDLAFGGQPHVESTGPSDQLQVRGPETELPWQPFALFAALVIVAGIVLTLARPHLARLTGIVTGCLGALLLFAAERMARAAVIGGLKKEHVVVPGTLDKLVETRFGYWLALLLLLGVAAFNAVELARDRRPPS
ncbi:hypothetical protein [Pseudonocardia acaciae]|uniref:hypothetical protein n=1 Tax=Pseudonocardia acaciae TaxID=551276 RepID=UPI0004904C64|nr:hypothetical protein [Pseudonocardia acaciae]